MVRHVLVLPAVSFVLGCIAPTSSDGGGGRNCTLIGCVNGVQMSVSVDASAEWVKGSTLEVCRNGVCGHASPSSLPTTTGAGVGVTLTGALAGTIVVGSTSTGWRFDVQVGLGESSSTFVDGDHYTVTVTGSDGTVVGSFDRTATYAESYPNGKDCDPEPCKTATLDAASIHVP